MTLKWFEERIAGLEHDLAVCRERLAEARADLRAAQAQYCDRHRPEPSDMCPWCVAEGLEERLVAVTRERDGLRVEVDRLRGLMLIRFANTATKNDLYAAGFSIGVVREILYGRPYDESRKVLVARWQSPARMRLLERAALGGSDE